MQFPPGIYIIDSSKNYVARTTKYTGVANGRTMTYKLVQDQVIHPYGHFMTTRACTIGLNILIAGHGAMAHTRIQNNPHIQKCKQMAENMAAFRLEGDGDGAIWHRVRSFYIGI